MFHQAESGNSRHVTSAARRALPVVCAAVFGLTSGSAPAQTELDPLQTVTGAVGDGTTATSDPVQDVITTVDQVVDTVSGSTDGATGGTSGGVTDSVSGTTDSVSDTAGAVTGTGGSTSTAGGTSGTSGGTSTTSGSGGSGGSGGGKAAARGTRQHTAFDRLPRRFELLLERIEFGRNVRANLRRLEQAFASATPEQRARILRLIKTEIKHLRKDGLTAGERARINRLQRALKILTRPTTTPTPTPSTPLHTLANAEDITAFTTGGASASSGSPGKLPFTGGSSPAPREPGAQAPADEGREGSLFGLPSTGSEPSLGVYLALAAVLLLAFAALALAAAPPHLVPAGRMRNLVRTSRTDLAVTGGGALATLALMGLFLLFNSLF
jgi:hypothetical protein